MIPGGVSGVGADDISDIGVGTGVDYCWWYQCGRC